MKITTLRIKRVFLLGILLKDKKKEYREKKPYYENLFKIKPDFIYFHDQNKTRGLVEVKNIKVIPTPKKMALLVDRLSPKSYEIKLGLSKEIKAADLKRLKSLTKNEIIKFLKGKVIPV